MIPWVLMTYPTPKATLSDCTAPTTALSLAQKAAA